MALPTYDDVRPTVEDVAVLEYARTGSAQGLGSAGGSDGTFTATTIPTDTQVEHFIDLALDLIVPQLDPDLTVVKYPAIRSVVALQAAILIEGSVFRETVDEGNVPVWSAIIARLMNGLVPAAQQTTAGGGGTVTSPFKPRRAVSVYTPTVTSTAPVPEPIDNLAG
jgi:hypothetical protein